MATISKKDRLIEEAQKFSLRGQFDKAAKNYEQILALEPSAINLRQKLAELLFKCGRVDDARVELETIGGHFSKNGFFLKAIAVYKQLQKISPGDISLSLTLAELNEKHGLIANSLSEYKLVYEYHERTGNAHEALNILVRMQNVDPQNVPIKIRLAEASAQQGEMDEAFSLFSHAVSLLLERNDTAALSRVTARIQQLFPHKPDFMLEILTGQVEQGNAAAVIDSIQSLLRSNPQNKRTWDLIIEAFKRLEQPQRVKIACQHYLSYFPNEPDAMLGLITCFTNEHNLPEAVKLLDQYESAVIKAGLLTPLESIYHALDKTDPINARVLEGLIRVAAAAGNEEHSRAAASRLASLRSVGGAPPLGTDAEASPFTGISADEPVEEVMTADSPFATNQELDPFAASDSEDALRDQTMADLSGQEEPVSVFEMTAPSDDEIEIEIELDYESPYDEQSQADIEPDEDSQDSWLDSVGSMFDTISTTPSGVRFGDEVDHSDAQSHFDLGQAFKEMGLFDEAINEFRQAALEPSRQVECLIMQCVCLRERGEVDKAIAMLQALLKPGLSEDESCSVKYELATGFQATGRKEEANVILNEIKATNPAFRDINSRINAANLSDSLDFSDDDLMNF